MWRARWARSAALTTESKSRKPLAATELAVSQPRIVSMATSLVSAIHRGIGCSGPPGREKSPARIERIRIIAREVGSEKASPS